MKAYGLYPIHDEVILKAYNRTDLIVSDNL
jgi:hypothetical protein